MSAERRNVNRAGYNQRMRRDIANNGGPQGSQDRRNGVMAWKHATMIGARKNRMDQQWAIHWALGLTMDDILNQLGLTMDDILDQLGLTMDDILDQLGLTMDDILDQLGLTMDDILDQLGLTSSAQSRLPTTQRPGPVTVQSRLPTTQCLGPVSVQSRLPTTQRPRPASVQSPANHPTS